MESFPDEIVVKIFAHFDIKTVHDVVARVCRRWASLAMDRTLNRHVVADYDDSFDFVERLPAKHHVSSIDICLSSFSKREFEWKIRYLRSNFPELTHLTIKDTLCDSNIALISESFTKLKYLNIIPLYEDSEEFLEALRLLEVAFVNIAANSEVVKWMANNCLNLREVHFTDFKKSVTSEPINALLLARRDHLTKLSLSSFPKGTLEAISKCANLRELYLCQLRDHFGDDLPSLAALKQLTVLHIVAMKNVDKDLFDEFIEALDMSHLANLKLAGMPFCDKNALHIVKRKPPLRKLDLCFNRMLTLEGVHCLAVNLKYLFTLISDTYLPQKVVDHIHRLSAVREFRYNDIHGNVQIMHK